jgi:hypothetical protein
MSRLTALDRLTFAVTGRRPTVSIQFEQNRKRVAVALEAMVRRHRVEPYQSKS